MAKSIYVEEGKKVKAKKAGKGFIGFLKKTRKQISVAQKKRSKEKITRMKRELGEAKLSTAYERMKGEREIIKLKRRKEFLGARLGLRRMELAEKELTKEKEPKQVSFGAAFAPTGMSVPPLEEKPRILSKKMPWERES